MSAQGMAEILKNYNGKTIQHKLEGLVAVNGMDVVVSQKNWNKTHQRDGTTSSKLLAGKGVWMTGIQL